jgi:transmembrane sensor
MMDRPPASGSQIEDEASEWLAVMNDRAVTLEQRTRFEAWLRADPENARIYGVQKAAWSAIGGMRHLLDDVSAQPAAGARHFALVAALLAVLVGGVFLTQRLHFLAPVNQFETATAQVEEVELEDGTLVTLGASSQIRVFFGKTERRVILTRGQAFFEVTHDIARPFYVTAANTRVRVVGTKFDVHYGPRAVRVAVAEGRVEVSSSPSNSPGASGYPSTRASAEATSNVARLEKVQGDRENSHGEIAAPSSTGEVVLTAGQAAVSEATGQIDAADSVDTEDLGAWRQGRLVYVDVHLRDVVADINRYYDGQIELADSKVGDLQFTAAFRADQIDRMLEVLEGALPITATRTGHHRILLSAKNSQR